MKRLFLYACISMLSSSLHSMDDQKPSILKKLSSFLQQKADSMRQKNESYEQSYAQGYLAANKILMNTGELKTMNQEEYGKALLSSYENT